jgi:hypothetical protein
MKKVILHTSGFALLLFLSIGSLGVLVFSAWVRQNIGDGVVGFGSVLGPTIVFLWPAYCGLYIFINKIELSEQSLEFRYLAYGLPKLKQIHVDLQAIQRVIIGDKKYISVVLKNNRQWKWESSKFYKQFVSHRLGTSLASQSALGFMPVLVICMTDGQVAIINTKPYSAAGFRKLIAGLRQRNIDVLIGSKSLNKGLE